MEKLSISTLKFKLEYQREYYDDLCFRTENLLKDVQTNQIILENTLKDIEELKFAINLIENFKVI